MVFMRFKGVKMQWFRNLGLYGWVFDSGFYARPTCVNALGRLHGASEGRPGRYPRQPGQGGNAAAVTSFLSGQDPAFHFHKIEENFLKIRISKFRFENKEKI